MEDRIFRVLEFNKIRELLKNETTNPMSAEWALSLSPYEALSEVRFQQDKLKETVMLYAKNGLPRMAGLKDLTSLLARLAIGGVLNAGELLAVGDALKIARNLIAYRQGTGEGLLVDAHFSMLASEKRLEEEIFNAIVSEEEISDNASPALFQIRRQISAAHSKVRETLNGIIGSSHYQKALQEAIITMRDGRYVVPVKSEHRGEISGIVHDLSSSGATVFIEPNGVVQANNLIRELAVKEQQEIERILAELSAKVSVISELLKSNQAEIIEIDFLFAKAKLALKQDASAPLMNDDRRIEIKKGRHPLIDPKRVVPIDLSIGAAFKTLVITGPNTGGKTVSLKTVGLFSLMALSGLQVPAAEGTELAMLDHIFADIGDEQSIEQSLSTFSGHMKTIVDIIGRVTDRSLVLFDELGAGTDPTEGAALAVAILQYTKAMGALTVATTHYSELKLYALQSKGVENACCEFDVDSLRPTYKLLIGVPGKSNAFAISKRLGLPDFIINSANGHLTDETIRFEDIISDLERSRSAAEEEKSRAERYTGEIERLKRELEQEKSRLEEARAKVNERAQAEARRVLEKAKAEADEIIKSLQRARIEQGKEANQTIEEARRKLNQKIKETDRAQLKKAEAGGTPPKKLEIGNSVHLIDIDQDGTVLAVPSSDGMVQVQVGIMKITSPLANLRLKQEKSKHIQESSSGRKRGGLNVSAAPAEIDLRGNNLEDAVYMAEKFIDSSVMAHLTQISIIHGKGTGVLRSGIHTMLKRNKSVNSYRLGVYGEGETGVTIVELK